MDIFIPKDKIKPGEVLTEEDYEAAANKALFYAVLGCAIPILELNVPRYATRAKRSQKQETREKAGRATNIATVVFFYVVLFPLVALTTIANLLLGTITAGIVSFLVYKKKSGVWPKRKIVIAVIAVVIFLAYGFYISLADL